MFRTENALILREVRFRESDRILTALTSDAGKLTLAAHGALSKKSKIAAATQLLTYSELTLFEKNGRFAVREGITKEGFAGLRQDLKRFALGCYFAECLEQYAAEEQPEPELMQLGLNCLYALSEGLRDSATVKAARFFCDSRESVFAEAGDFVIPMNAGEIGKEQLLGTLGELFAGEIEGRTSDEDITVFESLGIAAEDLASVKYLADLER